MSDNTETETTEETLGEAASEMNSAERYKLAMKMAGNAGDKFLNEAAVAAGVEPPCDSDESEEESEESETEESEIPDGNVGEVNAWIGTNSDRAQAVLDSDEDRVTVIEYAESVILAEGI